MTSDTGDQFTWDSLDGELFLRALRAYSESCEFPALIADCPFSIDTNEGRACGEECMDLLAKHNAPPSTEQIPLADGFALRPRRPRPRRGPESTAKPFDAAEIRAVEEVRAVSAWSPVTLIGQLRRYFFAEDPDVPELPAELATECIEVLDSRGFDTELLVRQGLSPWIMSGVFTKVLLQWVGTPARSASPSPWDSWVQLAAATTANMELPSEGERDISLEDEQREIAQKVAALGRSPFIAHLRAWIETAPIEQVIARDAPTLEDFRARIHETPTTRESTEYARWLVDRFTETYLSHWQTSSLTLEWRYMHAQLDPRLGRSEMTVRRIQVNDLQAEMAERLANTPPSDGPALGNASQSSGRINSSALVTPAIRFLREGRRAEAAALFEAARDLDPMDADAHNNLGFCLLPDQPNEALIALETARRLGYGEKLLNATNRAWGLWRLGRFATALAVAESAFIESNSDEPQAAIVWSMDESPKLLDVLDLELHLVESAVVIAEASGDPTSIAVWRTRLSSAGTTD